MRTEAQKQALRTWIDELRSGCRAQGQGRLRQRKDDGVTRECCLGVACDLHRQISPEAACWEGMLGHGFTYLGSSTLLPRQVRDWLGLSDKDPEVCGHPLSWWNDHGLDFNGIADLIEEHILMEVKK